MLLLLGLAAGPAAGTTAAAPPPASHLPPAVQAAFATAKIPTGAVAVVVEKLDDPRRGFRRLAENAAQPMNPASVMKLFTTGAALDLLGPARTWQTEVRVTQLPRGGVLKGSLYLKGSGDPKLNLAQFWQLLRELRQRGVREIRGDLVLDRSLFELPPHDPAAFDGEGLRPYNVGADAALIGFQALRFLLIPDPAGKKVEVLQLTPDARLRVVNRLHQVGGECRDWRDRIAPRISGSTLELAGPFPTSCGEKPLNLSPLAADAQVDGLFRALWRELGGSLRGKVVGGRTPDDSLLLASHESPPLAELVRDINKFSNNVMARQLFLALSAETPPATYDKSTARLRDWLQRRGIAAPELVIENGAGLSRLDRASADTLAALLRSIWHSPTMPELVSSLPILGEDGTMKKRGNGNRGRAHLKTGYLDGVRALAGYVIDQRGERWLLVALVNHANAMGAKEGLDRLVDWVIAADGSAASPAGQ
ncbi:MAG TPA: D-alanyl-D-alanine carboxypeptidase/D-alanyl-D-alanine-endopeptidase [Rhodocyclaceae bacterium]|nr:D-alanyl-D-alanine carboxypeptidase/D-alanyl-D-alanine-endopeptidase [Rhodocyclaceae bacterium]